MSIHVLEHVGGAGGAGYDVINCRGEGGRTPVQGLQPMHSAAAASCNLFAGMEDGDIEVPGVGSMRTF